MSKRNKRPRLKRHGIMKRWSGNSRPDRDHVREALKRAETCGTPMPPDRSTQASQRLKVMRLMWRDMIKQGLDKFNSITIDENSRETITRFFSGNKNFLVHTNKQTNVMRRSCEYYSSETMMKKYNYGQITWVRIFEPPKEEEELLLKLDLEDVMKEKQLPPPTTYDGGVSRLRKDKQGISVANYSRIKPPTTD